MSARHSTTVVVALLVAAFAAAPALGSAIIGRNVSRATLRIDSRGRAHVSYRSGGRFVALTAWGAVDARTPSRARPQVKFRIRYGTRGDGD
jgi:hypothetical protein